MWNRALQIVYLYTDEEEEAPLSDAQLSAAYAHNGPVDGTQWMDECVVVLETPDKKESTETKPAKRNRFATKLLSKKKANILSNGEVVTSRWRLVFFNWLLNLSLSSIVIDRNVY